MITDYDASRRILAYPTCILCVGIPQRNGWEDRNTNGRVNNADDPPCVIKTPGEIWSTDRGAFAPGGQHAGLCRAFLVLLVATEHRKRSSFRPPWTGP